MKSKITLIVLIILILALGGLSIFLGYKYSSIKNNNSDMNEQMNNLNSQIEDYTKQIEELTNTIQTTEETSQTLSVKLYSNDKNTLLLYLIENENPPSLSDFVDSREKKKFLIVWRDPISIYEEAGGSFTEENGNINLKILTNRGNIVENFSRSFSIDAGVDNGTNYLICSTDGQNIIFGSETLTLK